MNEQSPPTPILIKKDKIHFNVNFLLLAKLYFTQLEVYLVVDCILSIHNTEFNSQKKYHTYI